MMQWKLVLIDILLSQIALRPGGYKPGFSAYRRLIYEESPCLPKSRYVVR
jgi:hypothetical protein